MSVGTRSLLIGAHWPPHTINVVLAWRWLYGEWPDWRELVAILLHDIGYFGCEKMDGGDGDLHPEMGARIADRLMGKVYGDLIRGHSAGYSEIAHVPLSKLYAADKASHLFESVRMFVARTNLTGEFEQYRARSQVNEGASDTELYRAIRSRMIRGGLTQVLSTMVEGLGSDRGR